MAIFARKATPLVESLASAGGDLRVKEANNHSAAEGYLDAAAKARQEAADAALKAKAVEEAVQILDKAGVTL